MARTKRDTSMQGPAHAGDPEPSEAHTGEHRRASARAPTVPFQMVTRRGAQKRTSGGSEEHAIASNDLASAGEEAYSEAAALPTPVGQGENEPEPQGEGSGVVPTADDTGDTPRRSSRVVPRKVAPPVQRPRLMLKLRLNPALLQAFVLPSATVPEHQVEGLEPSASHSTRLKLVVGDGSAKPNSPLPSPVSPMTEDHQPVAPPTEGPAPTPRPKRPRKPKAASPGPEEGNAEEERPPKKRRKYKKSADAAAAGEEPILPSSAELAAIQQPEPPLPVSAPPVPPMSPKPVSTPDLEPAADAPEAEPLLEPHQEEVSQPEVQKRRGRPPKSELLKRQRQPRQVQVVAAPVAPVGHPVGSLAHQFREQMPEGMNMLDIIALAKHMRAKDLQAKKGPMKRSIKRGYRVEHRVTREWCAQRRQTLMGLQRKIGRHMQRANIGLVDQAIRLAQTDPTYFSEDGLGAPFYLAGLQQAAEQREKTREIGDMRRDFAIQAMTDRERHVELRWKRQVRNEVVDGLEKLAVERDHYSKIVRAFGAEHPDEVDDIIEDCEAAGEDPTEAIFKAACKAHPGNVKDEVEKIWRSRGHGLGPWFKFTDDNRMDVDEEPPAMIMEREQPPESNERGASPMISDERQQPPMLFERGGSPESEEEEQPPESMEIEDSPMPDESIEPPLPMEAGELKISDERGEAHIDFAELLEVASQELQANKASSTKDLPSQAELELLDVLASAAAEQGHLPGTPKLLAPLSRGPSLSKEPSPAFLKDQSPAFIKEPSPVLIKEPSPAPFNEPSPSLLKEPSPASFKEPSPSVFKEPSPVSFKEPSPASFRESSPAFSEDDHIAVTSASPHPSYGGDGSVDERASNFSGRMAESSAEPGFALSGPAPPPDVLKPSAMYPEADHRSRFTNGESNRRWSDNRIYPMERAVFSPIGTHHHFLPGPSPPPLQSRGSSVHSLPPPTALSSPGRLLPSPVPSTRFPAAYQALPQRSPSPGFFNPLPHDPRYRGDQNR